MAAIHSQSANWHCKRGRGGFRVQQMLVDNYLNFWKHLNRSKPTLSKLYIKKRYTLQFVLRVCWRAKSLCYSRVDCHVVWPANWNQEGLGAKVTLGFRWGRGCSQASMMEVDENRRWWWWVGEPRAWSWRELMDGLPQTGSPLSDPYRWLGHNYPLLTAHVWLGKALHCLAKHTYTHTHKVAAVHGTQNFRCKDLLLQRIPRSYIAMHYCRECEMRACTQTRTCTQATPLIIEAYKLVCQRRHLLLKWKAPSWGSNYNHGRKIKGAQTG